MPKRNTYHSLGDLFWAKQEENGTPEEHWRKLVSLRKLRIQGHQTRRPAYLEIHHQYYRQKITGKTHPRKNSESQNNNGSGNPRQL